MPTIVISENSVRDYTGVTDTQIKESAPTTNYSAATTMEATSYGSGDRTNALIAVAAPGLGGAISVSSATFEAYQQSAEAGTRNISLFKLLRGDASATWNTYDGTNNWTTAGGLGNGTDYDSTAIVTLAVAATVEYKSWSNAGLAAYVQTQINAGNPMKFILQRNPIAAQDTTYNVFFTSNEADTFRPKLTVVYTLSSPPQFFQYAWPHQLHARR